MLSPCIFALLTSRVILPTPPLPPPASASHPQRIVIQGVTLNGRAFRPSDWAERLCGVMSTFGGDHQMRYLPFVRPVMLDGVPCVVVAPALRDIEPRAYRFLLDFAKDNELVVLDPAMSLADEYCPVPGNALDKLTRQEHKRKPPTSMPGYAARLAVCLWRATCFALWIMYRRLTYACAVVWAFAPIALIAADRRLL